ncbi:hypothetical protein KIL84_006075 [Mauremys mutica]|uniref:Uncharacterized protein n=1 Tax=Mauremys mutica TaxID=74926 RepID=A0A9D3XJ00_9SAUR|nr:hypothetical protein KIL84_006075 [Mauremys mutica]
MPFGERHSLASSPPMLPNKSSSLWRSEHPFPLSRQCCQEGTCSFPGSAPFRHAQPPAYHRQQTSFTPFSSVSSLQALSQGECMRREVQPLIPGPGTLIRIIYIISCKGKDPYRKPMKEQKGWGRFARPWNEQQSQDLWDCSGHPQRMSPWHNSTLASRQLTPFSLSPLVA